MRAGRERILAGLVCKFCETSDKLLAVERRTTIACLCGTCGVAYTIYKRGRS